MAQVRSLIEDIRDVRFHKVENGLETISGRTHAVKVNFPPSSELKAPNQLPFLVPRILLKLLFELDVIYFSLYPSVFPTSLPACFIGILLPFSQLKNLSAMEVNIVRPFMVRTLQAFYKHDSPQMIQQADNTGSRPTPVTDRGPRVSLHF
jgi:hypothetical protein